MNKRNTLKSNVRNPFAACATAAALGLTLLISGCATTPKRVATLEEAKTRMQAVEQDPIAERAASEQLRQAREALRAADRSMVEKESAKEVQHLSYLALKKVETAEAAVAEAQARDRVAKAEAERNRILLESRERDLENRTAQAQAAQQQAQAAQQEAEAAKLSAQQEAEQAAAARAELMKLRQELSDLQAKPTERGMVVTLGDVLFDVNKAQLKPGADRTVGRLQEFLREHEGVHVKIEGHTDSTGSSEYNTDLSQRRADAVARALETRGVESSRIESKGLGEDFPVASNDSNAGRQQNRRVEIVFSDNEGRFQGSAASASR